MISFETFQIEKGYLHVKVSLKVIKQIDKGELNRKINFYYEMNGAIKQLDNNNFYTIAIPPEKKQNDILLNNDDVIYFYIFDQELVDGINVRIMAIDAYSNTIKFTSGSIFAKTKAIWLPQIKVDTSFHGALTSTINLNIQDLFEAETAKRFYIIQTINTEGIGEMIVARSSQLPLTNGVTRVIYNNLSEYGSYEIVTTIYNLYGSPILRIKNYYYKAVEPLPIFIKYKHPTLDNHFSRGVVKAYYKKDSVTKQIVKVKVNL